MPDRESDSEALFGKRRPAATTKIIDGEAVVLARRPRPTDAPPASGSSEWTTDGPEEASDFEAVLNAARTTSRRARKVPTPDAERHHKPDLVFHRRGILRSRKPADGFVPIGAYLASRHRNALRYGALAAGFMLGFFAFPLFLVAAPDSPVAATVETASSKLPGGIELSSFRSAISENGGGTLVSVAGSLTVKSSEKRLPARLAVEVTTSDGQRFSKPFLLRSSSQSGSIGFESRFLLPAASTNAAAIAIVAPGANRTSLSSE